MRIHQIWIILNNGVCPIHLLYKGKALDENLFAGFVRALFSFSKDMSDGERSISSMTFGDNDIHYLAHPEEKYFVAIAADVGINQDIIDLYLKYISEMFLTNYPVYIETLPPFEPTSFSYFKDSVDFFIRSIENKHFNSLEGKADEIIDKPYKIMQSSINFVILQTNEDQILRLYNKNNLDVIGTYYPESGNIIGFSLQHNENFIVLLTDSNQINIKPVPVIESSDTPLIQKTLEKSASWVYSHPSKNLIFYGDNNNVYQLDIEKNETVYSEVDLEINKVLIHSSNKIYIINKENKLYSGNLPLTGEKLELEDLGIKEEIYSINYGPEDILIIKCINESIYFWDGINNKILLRDRLSPKSKISFSEKDNLIFLITDYNEFFIYELAGEQLVNYNLVDKGIGACVSDSNKLSIFYYNGSIKPFPATINREHILQLRQVLTKRVDTVENHITRIHKGFQKVIQNLESQRPSTAVKHDLNQIKVFKQQIKRLIDQKLIDRTSILRDLYYRLLGYQNQVNQILKLIEELEINIESILKALKENELSGKSSKERVEDYLSSMKPRQTIGMGDLADNLQIPYEEVLKYIKTMEQHGILPGFLTRGSGSSIKDSVVFVKKDPKFKESGITSF